jgi:hypothetical protein
MAQMGEGTPLSLAPARVRILRSQVLGEFPKLNDSFALTSLPDERYNCVAWAAEDTARWWWPDVDHEAYWPAGVEREETVTGYIRAFATLGFELCASPELEPGFPKIAVFATGDKPKHMARQLSSGIWTSKLGEWWDISHVLDEVESSLYGKRVILMRRAE